MLTLKEVIEILIEYNVELKEFPLNNWREVNNKPKIRGLIIDDLRRIVIDKNQSKDLLRESILHELVHAKYFKSGGLSTLSQKQIENTVQKESEEVYKKLYKRS